MERLELNHEYIFYLCGVLSVLSLFPLLFLNNFSDDNSSFNSIRMIIGSDHFKYFVSASLAVAVPLSLDLIVDFITKRGVIKHLLPRAAICMTLLITSCLHIYYSIFQEKVLATIVILSMRAIMCWSIGSYHILIHKNHMTNKPFCSCAYLAMFCWNVGTVIKLYGAHTSKAILMSRLVQLVALLFAIGIICKHIYMVIKGQTDGWYLEWQRAALEGTVIVALTVAVFSALYFRNDMVRGVSATSLVILSYTSVSFLVVMSTIFTHEIRHDFAEAQQSLGVKRMFVRYVSHEVRTPLSSCMLGIEYMKAAILNPTEACIEEITGILDEVSEGCNSAIVFMNNLLLYEKVDSMEMPLYLKREDLSAVCAQVLKTFQMSARQLAVNLSLDVHESLSVDDAKGFKAFSKVDGPKVVIVLRNLTSNALKFTPKGGRVSLSVIPIDKSMSAISGIGSFRGSFREQLPVDILSLQPSPPADTTHFRVILSDTGRGMSQEEQKQLFTKIVQFSPNENQKGGGSGIGLFLSHKIMADHNLKIQVYSEGTNGSGTQFFIDFPAMLPEAEEVVDQTIAECTCIGTTSESAIQDIEAAVSSDDPLDIEEEGNLAELDDRNPLPRYSKKSSLIESLSNSVRSANSMRSAHHSLRSSAHGPTRHSHREAELTSRQQKIPLGMMRILLIDDSVMNRKMLTRTLKQHHVGASHEGAGDGLELLSLMGVPGATDSGYEAVVTDHDSSDTDVTPVFTLRGKTDFDVIILDDNMTYMNGSEAVKILREYGYEGLVIGLTGSALEEDLNAFCAAGVDYALPKPFVIKDFINVVTDHFMTRCG
jgi:signal transduction histidine kinase/CheY-like chemotaxis protein